MAAAQWAPFNEPPFPAASGQSLADSATIMRAKSQNNWLSDTRPENGLEEKEQQKQQEKQKQKQKQISIQNNAKIGSSLGNNRWPNVARQMRAPK